MFVQFLVYDQLIALLDDKPEVLEGNKAFKNLAEDLADNSLGVDETMDNQSIVEDESNVVDKSSAEEKSIEDKGNSFN